MVHPRESVELSPASIPAAVAIAAIRSGRSAVVPRSVGSRSSKARPVRPLLCSALPRNAPQARQAPHQCAGVINNAHDR